RDIEILGLAERRLKELSAGEKAIFLQEAVLVSNHNFLPELRQGKAEAELTAESVTVGPNMAEDGEALPGTENRADLVEAGLAHSFSGVSISWRISKTRAPRSIESSR